MQNNVSSLYARCTSITNRPTTPVGRLVAVGISLTALALTAAGCGSGGSHGNGTQFLFPIIGPTDAITLQNTTSDVLTPAGGSSQSFGPTDSYVSALDNSGFGYIFESDAPITTATLSGVGKIEVATHENSSGRVTSYDYFRNDSSGVRYYGSDTVDSAGNTTSSTRVNPGVYFPSPSAVEVGKSTPETFTLTTTDEPSGDVTFQETVTLTYKLERFESITVPAGNFSNVARFTLNTNTAVAATSTQGAASDASSGTEWIADGLGLIKDDVTDTYITFHTNGSEDQTDVTTNVDQLAYASIDGTVYGSPTPIDRSKPTRAAAPQSGNKLPRILSLLGLGPHTRH